MQMKGTIMNNFLYAMTESFGRMQEKIHMVLENPICTEKDKNELFLHVGNCVHSILDYAERVKVDEEEKGLLSAFRYINNSLKHSEKVVEITEQQGGFSFPTSFPLTIPRREVVWSVVDNGYIENQRRNYKKFLAGKNVIETCEEIIKILEKYHF